MEKATTNDVPNREEMITRSTWDVFRDWGLLWWVNRLLHTFGWAICVEVGSDGTVTEAYPARCKFRGFSRECEDNGFLNLHAHLSIAAEDLFAETQAGIEEELADNQD